MEGKSNLPKVTDVLSFLCGAQGGALMPAPRVPSAAPTGPATDPHHLANPGGDEGGFR